MKNRVGQVYGKLTVEARADTAPNGLVLWTCRCTCGKETVSRGDSLQNGQATSCGQGECHPRKGTGKDLSPVWVGDDVGYVGAHYRVRRERGPASLHSCTDCGDQARDWSYDHGETAPLFDERGRPYSTNPERYAPRCLSCHTKFDKQIEVVR